MRMLFKRHESVYTIVVFVVALPHVPILLEKEFINH